MPDVIDLTLTTPELRSVLGADGRDEKSKTQWLGAMIRSGAFLPAQRFPGRGRSYEFALLDAEIAVFSYRGFTMGWSFDQVGHAGALLRAGWQDQAVSKGEGEFLKGLPGKAQSFDDVSRATIKAIQDGDQDFDPVIAVRWCVTDERAYHLSPWPAVDQRFVAKIIAGEFDWHRGLTLVKLRPILTPLAELLKEREAGNG